MFPIRLSPQGRADKTRAPIRAAIAKESIGDLVGAPYYKKPALSYRLLAQTGREFLIAARRRSDCNSTLYIRTTLTTLAFN
jgi:hypothetical protein